MPFSTEAGVTLYTVDIPQDRINQVFINDIEYEYRDLKDSDGGYAYSFLDGDLFVQPTPSETWDGYILYESKPEEMTEADLEAEPAFLEDYHELFALGIAKKLAAVERDFKTANELEARFSDMARKAVTNLKKGNQKKIRIVRRWG
jgi:hypothetical protein